MTLGSSGSSAVVAAAAAVPVLVAAAGMVARRVDMQPAASVPPQHETKSEPPTAAQELQNAGVQADRTLADD